MSSLISISHFHVYIFLSSFYSLPPLAYLIYINYPLTLLWFSVGLLLRFLAVTVEVLEIKPILELLLQ